MLNNLTDNWERKIDYLRIAVTDRCNLRCFYCMPEKGINYLSRKELLSYEELLRLIKIFSNLGVSKIRLTGGEPFIRKNLMNFIKKINDISGIKSIHITTNGVFTYKYLDEFKKAGIKSVNLSLDTRDEKKFKLITRRDEFQNVMKSFHGLIDRGIKTKVNMVVIERKNTDDILPMLELTKNYPIEMRYIEEMPFNGGKNHNVTLRWNHNKILETIKSKYPNLKTEINEKSATAITYSISDFKGKFGIIPAYSRTFCNTCNRVRLTSQGIIRTCLYGEGVLNLKKIMRTGSSNNEIKKLIQRVISSKEKNGFIAELNRKNQIQVSESMARIGG